VIQSGAVVGVYTLRRSCVGSQTGAHCGLDGCQLCHVLGLHRDLQGLQALGEVSHSSLGRYKFDSQSHLFDY